MKLAAESNEKAWAEDESNQFNLDIIERLTALLLEALNKNSPRQAIDNCGFDNFARQKLQVSDLKHESEDMEYQSRRSEINDAIVEKIARLLNESPCSLLLLSDIFNAWIKLINNSEREYEGDLNRKHWNDCDSFSVDRD